MVFVGVGQLRFVKNVLILTTVSSTHCVCDETSRKDINMSLRRNTKRDSIGTTKRHKIL